FTRPYLIQFDFEAEALEFAHEDVEALRDVRLGERVPLDDGLVGLRAALHVAALDGEELAEDVGGAVGVERPHLHLAEALAAELRLAAQRLLGDERVRPDAPGVELVLDEVRELEHVDLPDRRELVERLAGAAVVELRAAGGREAGGLELGGDVLHRGAVEGGRRVADAELVAGPAEGAL